MSNPHNRPLGAGQASTSSIVFFEGPIPFRERLAKVLAQVSARDRRWFAKHPKRRLRARAITLAERWALYAQGFPFVPFQIGTDYVVVATVTGAYQFVSAPVADVSRIETMSEGEILAVQDGPGREFVGHIRAGRGDLADAVAREFLVARSAGQSGA